MFQRRYILLLFCASSCMVAGQHELRQDRNPFFLQHLQKDNPYRNTVAQVRTHGFLPNEEKEFVTNRSKFLKSQVENIVGYEISDEQVPRIAVSGSGGGYRAMISLIGFLEGAQLSSLPITYLAGVSGATWCIMPWLASGQSITDFKNSLFPTLDHGLLQISQARDINDVTLLLLKKWMFGQPITFVDIYGSVLSYNLLADQQRNSLHGTLAPRIRDGLYPLPIGCALGGDNKNPYYWFEFSPFEVGSPELNSYIPTWAFGRGFDKGSSVDFAPEQTLGYFLGVFGAAFAESEYKDFFDELLHKLREKNQAILSSIVNQILKDRNRKDVGGGKVHNFMHGLDSNPLTNVENLMFIDAGIIFDEARGVGANVPLLPFYRKERAVDIIIVVDASSNAGSAGELGNALDYVRKLGYVVPEVDYVKAGESVITTWYPVDNGPIIIYMPNIKNEQYSPDFDPRDITQVYNTFNFKYSLEQAQKLSDLISYNVQQSKDTIYQVIRNVVARNSNA